MCTLAMLRRPKARWPVIIAANRDEMTDRPARGPARHWPDRPNVRAGLDLMAGGSWMGVNDEGVVAALLNRMGTLGPLPGKRSRGELTLDALDFPDAKDAAESLSHLDADAYRPFNMIIADNRDAFWLKNDGESISALSLGEGMFMITAYDMNDETDFRIKTFLPEFGKSAPDPDKGDWTGWRGLLAEKSRTDRPQDGMCFALETGFATQSAMLVALPSMERGAEAPQWLYSGAPPDRPDWSAVPS